MNLTTAQKLAQFEAAQKEAIAREKKLLEEIALIQAQQKKNRQEIEVLTERQKIITKNVEALTALDTDLFDEIMAIVSKTTPAFDSTPDTDSTPDSTSSTPYPDSTPDSTSDSISTATSVSATSLDPGTIIPTEFIDLLKTALEPFCLGIDEIVEEVVFLVDHDNLDSKKSPGALHYKKNKFQPSPMLKQWLENQNTTWEEMETEITNALSKVKSKTEIFEHPYQQLNDNIFIQISEEKPLTGKFKQHTDMPRYYEILRQDSQIILEVTTTNGSKVRSNWSKFPAKYRTAARLILKHYTETPELLTRFHEAYPNEAEQAKRDLYPEQYPLGYSEKNPVGKGQTPCFQMKA